MNIKRHTSAGYIMVFALTMISLMTILVTFIVSRVQTYYPATVQAEDSMRAHLLALGGVQIGMAQLADFVSEKKEKESDDKQKKQNPDDKDRQLLAKLLPRLNVWQAFPLKKNIEGVDGVIKICIGSEDGKLDLNQLWDFKNNQFAFEKDENKKKLYAELFGRIDKLGRTTGTFPALQKFIKERGYVINDITELLMIQEYKKFAEHVFYEPSGEQKKEPALYLTDIFTIWTGKKKINPWLLSAGWQQLFDFKVDPKKDMAPILKEFKKSMQWKTAWDKTLLPLYEKNFNSLPKDIDSLLDAKFEPKIFSVLSYGIFGKTTDKVLAIIELVTSKEKDAAQKVEIKIRKLYWL